MKDKKSNTSLLLTLLVLLIVAGFLLKFLKQEEYSYYTNPKGEARYNSYLAAQMLISKYNFTSQTLKNSFADVNAIPNDQSIIFISDDRVYQQQTLLNDLTAWVRKGGYLLLPVTSRAKASQLANIIPGLDVEFNKMALEKEAREAVGVFDFLGKQYSLSLDRSIHITTKSSTYWKIEDQHGVYAIAIKSGAGAVLVFSDLSIFNNKNIANNDHASLFLDILVSVGNKNLLHILYPKNPSTFDVVFSYPLTLVLFVLVIMIFFWLNWGFIGPINKTQGKGQATLYSSLRFAGQYFWRNVPKSDLYHMLLQELENEIEYKYRDWQNLVLEKKIAYLIRVTELPQALIESVYTPPIKRNKSHYLEFCTNIQKIRNRL